MTKLLLVTVLAWALFSIAVLVLALPSKTGGELAPAEAPVWEKMQHPGTPDLPEREYAAEPLVEEVVWPDDTTVNAVAKVLWHEARGVPSDTEVACVVWTACNRVDAGLAGTVLEAVTAPGQYAYDPDAPVEPRLESLAQDVLLRWAREKNGQDQVGRVLPADFMWFHGDGEHNWFRNQYRGGDTWYYTLESPYET